MATPVKKWGVPGIKSANVTTPAASPSPASKWGGGVKKAGDSVSGGSNNSSVTPAAGAVPSSAAPAKKWGLKKGPIEETLSSPASAAAPMVETPAAPEAEGQKSEVEREAATASSLEAAHKGSQETAPAIALGTAGEGNAPTAPPEAFPALEPATVTSQTVEEANPIPSPVESFSPPSKSSSEGNLSSSPISVGSEGTEGNSTPKSFERKRSKRPEGPPAEDLLRHLLPDTRGFIPPPSSVPLIETPNPTPA